MLYASESVAVTLADGVATLSMRFPGSPANALNLDRLRELGRAFDAVAVCPHVTILVVRSGFPGGFCGGFDPAVAGHLATDGDREVFAREGQRILARLVASRCVTVALLEGLCLGPGAELAAACDYRYAVTGPDAWVGPDGGPRGWGVTRLRTPAKVVTAWEACRLGFVDDAFTARRASVESELHIDRHRRRPRKRTVLVTAGELATQRRSVQDWVPRPLATIDAVPPGDVGVAAGDAACLGAAVEASLRGRRAVVLAGSDGELSANDAAAGALFAEAVRRGRVTPLECTQAAARLTHTLDGSLLARLPRILTAQPAALRFLKLSPWATVTGAATPPASGVRLGLAS